MSIPIGLMRKWVDNLCEVLASYSLLDGLSVPDHAVFLERERPEGWGAKMEKEGLPAYEGQRSKVGLMGNAL